MPAVWTYPSHTVPIGHFEHSKIQWPADFSRWTGLHIQKKNVHNLLVYTSSNLLLSSFFFSRIFARKQQNTVNTSPIRNVKFPYSKFVNCSSGPNFSPKIFKIARLAMLVDCTSKLVSSLATCRSSGFEVPNTMCITRLFSAVFTSFYIFPFLYSTLSTHTTTLVKTTQFVQRCERTVSVVYGHTQFMPIKLWASSAWTVGYEPVFTGHRWSVSLEHGADRTERLNNFYALVRQIQRPSDSPSTSRFYFAICNFVCQFLCLSVRR